MDKDDKNDTSKNAAQHMMPDLPNTGLERDTTGFVEFFENPNFRPDGLKLVQNGLGTRQDYHYAEYQPPSPPPIPDWLQEMFANDSSPAMEAETEAIPPAPIAGPPPLPPPAQAPAPVEDRMPTPIRR